MKNLLVKELEKFGYPVFLQGTMNPDEAYPESFITYYTNPTDDDSFYDNESKASIWNFEVTFYSSDPLLVDPEQKPKEIREALKKAGFLPQGKGQDTLSDEKTHTGWLMEFIYEERN